MLDWVKTAPNQVEANEETWKNRNKPRPIYVKDVISDEPLQQNGNSDKFPATDNLSSTGRSVCLSLCMTLYADNLVPIRLDIDVEGQSICFEACTDEIIHKQIVKLKGFSKFDYTTDGLASANILIKSLTIKPLHKFLRAHCEGDTLAVADSPPQHVSYYEGVVESFDQSKMKDKVLYDDGDEDVLNLNDRQWMLLEDVSAIEPVPDVPPEKVSSPLALPKKGVSAQALPIKDLSTQTLLINGSSTPALHIKDPSTQVSRKMVWSTQTPTKKVSSTQALPTKVRLEFVLKSCENDMEVFHHNWIFRKCMSLRGELIAYYQI
ncbi:hypothetical protein Tco_1379554 [Tanacetum coccineum]